MPQKPYKDKQHEWFVIFKQVEHLELLLQAHSELILPSVPKPQQGNLDDFESSERESMTKD